MTLSSVDFRYIQGYDRFVFVVYAVALDFALHFGLCRELAEAICYRLAQELITLVQIGSFLEEPMRTQLYFDEKDQTLMDYAPAIMTALRMDRHGSIHFALRWQILLFADEYRAKPLLFLWDKVVEHRDVYKSFLYGLCIAHVRQVPPPIPDEITVEKIQRYKDWNVFAAVEFAEDWIRRPAPGPAPPLMKTLIVVIFASAVILLVMRWIFGSRK